MERLKELRKAKKMTQKELAEEFGLAESTISLYESGRRSPDYPTLKLLSNYFEVSTDYLLGGGTGLEKPQKGNWIPVLGRVQAGVPKEAVEDIIDYEELTNEMAKTGEHFALQISGDSMEPKFSEGDVVIVRKQEEVENGDIAVVMINGDEATVKKFMRKTNGVFLLPTNPAFEPLFFTEDQVAELPLKILGKVVELRAKF